MNTRYIVLLVLAAVFGAAIGNSVVLAERRDGANALPFKQIKSFREIFDRIQSDYVEEVSEEDLLEYAIRGMLAGLDPHSNYLNQKEYEDIRVGTSGKFGGLGIEVTMEDGFVKVVAPIDDTPAKRAGMQTGDLIVRVDDKPVKGMSLREAVDLMRGEPGSKISLTVLRKNRDKPFRVDLVRAIIQVKSVRGEDLGEGFSYIRIANFTSTTTRNLLNIVQDMKKKGEIKGLILDLRSNPGGVLSAAVGVSDAFLESGLVVYTDGRDQRARLKYKANAGDIIHGAPLVLLVDGGSASASEIVAGALQDHGRALIMGTQTFGKGSVQTIQELSNGDAVKLTTARYFTPKGRSIQARGIEPDIDTGSFRFVERNEKEEENGVNPLREADLEGHLEGGLEDNNSSKNNAASEDSSSDLLKKDIVVYEALNLLKGIVLLNLR